MKALWMAENINATLHNIYTLRGAPVRDPLRWSKYINEALYRFGVHADVMFASHHWPRWGNARIQEVLRGQRDLYANMNNQVLHLANQGVTTTRSITSTRCPRASKRSGIAVAITVRLSTTAAAWSSDSLASGLQSDDPNSAFTVRFGSAVCGNDGWI